MRSFLVIGHLFLVASSSARQGYSPVYIIRHGEKPAVNDNRQSLELSLRGEIRAAALSGAFFPQYNPSKYRHIDVVVTQQPSEDFPIKRELHTAQAIISHTSAPLRQFKFGPRLLPSLLTRGTGTLRKPPLSSTSGVVS
ncbi:hypothetical protein FOZ61_008401 [Perkinsus olseni]|uniref:Uncharacterized protein n=1 Tax=Perkinsus olseni TaxID=32597 RepID=A0A7J6L4V6_PEROL|nr:hypothetical protein FOZ61_008401 [Perkinsus olseni]